MISSGSQSAKIWLVGEALGPDEKTQQKPFVGYTGMELRKMLGEVGILPHETFMCNVLDAVPPHGKIENCFYTAKDAKSFGVERINGKYPNTAVSVGRETLRREIGLHRPNLVVALGATPLWALCGEIGITKWRGSILNGVHDVKVVPTFNPAAITRQWSWRWLAVQDLRRCLMQSAFPEIRYPNREYVIAPSLDVVMDFLGDIKDQTIVADTETWGGQIDCIGIGTSKDKVICIPFNSFVKDNPNYWSLEDEVTIVLKIKEVMKTNGVVWQNCLYDMQYLAHDWGYLPNTTDDIMIMHHTCFSELRKALEVITSLHCVYYRFWKEEGKKWNPVTDDVNTHWTYNCDDCAYTFEDFTSLNKAVDDLDQREQYNFLMKLVPPVLRMMLRGCRVNKKYKDGLSTSLQEAKDSRRLWFNEVLGHDLNPDSNPQMTTLIYDDFGVKEIRDRKTKGRTMNDAAITKIKRENGLLRPLLEKVEEYRSIRVFKSNFADALLRDDERIGSSVNICGTNTYRFSYSKDAFGSGGNLQTIPRGTEKE